MKRGITFWGEFGGGGKTTLTANTAAALGRSGDRVLAIDLDPQPAGLTDHVLGQDGRGHTDLKLAELLVDPAGKDPRDIIIETEHFDLIPSDDTLADVERALHAEKDVMTERFQLQKALKPIYQQYDYILADPQATLNLVVDNALVATRNVVIPVELTRKGSVSIEGVQETINNMEEGYRQLQDDFNINILAVVPNMVADANIADETREELLEDGVPVTPFNIRQRTCLQYAWKQNMSIFEYDEKNELREYERDVLRHFAELAQIVRKGTVHDTASKREVTA